MNYQTLDVDEFIEARVGNRSGSIDQRPLEEPDAASAKEAAPQQAATMAISVEMSRAVMQPLVLVDETSLKAALKEPELTEVTALVADHQKELDALAASAKTKLKVPLSEIEKQETHCVTPDLAPDLQHIHLQRQKILIGSGPLLAGYLRNEQTRLENLENFKIQNRLMREAHYPSSQILSIGILVILVVIEAGLNGVLFAASNDQGLFGGWLEAIVLSITNVGTAFLLGRLVLPQLNQRNLLVRGTAASLMLLGSILLVTINLLGAHYGDSKTQAAQASAIGHHPARDAAGETRVQTALEGAFVVGAQGAEAKQVQALSSSAEYQALERTFETPLRLQSFTGVFLLIIGLWAPLSLRLGMAINSMILIQDMDAVIVSISRCAQNAYGH